MSWNRLEAARHLSSESTETILRLLIEAEADAAALPAVEIEKITRFVDEAGERVAHGGTLHLVAAGPVAHLVRFAEAETRSWFPGVLPIAALTDDGQEQDEDAIRHVDESVTPDDIVLCVSRSGSRSWTCTAIRKANMIGALTASLTCARDNPVSRESDMPIVVETGAEAVMGCVQYRAATVVKVVLDGILLALVARCGGLWGDVPIGAEAVTESWRLVAAAAGIDHLRARSLVATSEGDVKVAIVMAKLGLEADEARLRLAAVRRRLEDVIGRA